MPDGFEIGTIVRVVTASTPEDAKRELDDEEENFPENPTFRIERIETANGVGGCIDLYKLDGLLCLYPAANLRRYTPPAPKPKRYRVYREVEAEDAEDAFSKVWNWELRRRQWRCELRHDRRGA